MSQHHSRSGFVFALSAYLIWGLAPLYFKWLEHVPAIEIIAHRIVWSLLLLLVILMITGKLASLRLLWPKLPWLIVSALLVSGNWLIFVWAITHDRISETSLGYYINPLVSVLLARIFLAERLTPLQLLAFIFAGGAVLIRLISVGELPWIALALAFSFGFYGLVRKNIHVAAVSGLAIETILLLPFAIAYLLWLYFKGNLSFGYIDNQTDVLLILAGVVTTFPLLCFAAAVVRLPLITISILQYIAPSMSLALAVLIYKEPFGLIDIISFACIWLGLMIFTFDGYRRREKYPYHSKIND